MRIKQKSSRTLFKALAVQLAFFGVLTAGLASTTAPAAAFPNPVKAVVDAITKADEKKQVNALQDYCQKQLPQDTQSACSTKAMGEVRDAAADQCKGKKGNALDSCIQKAGQAIIDKVKQQNPKNAQAAGKALTNAAKGGGGGGGGGQRTTSVATAGNQSSISAPDLPDPGANQGTIHNILKFFFALIGAFAVLSITLSGFKYITSAGDAQKTSEAKNGIVYSLVGLMLAIVAEALVVFVVARAS
jgi:hypothetical protein